MTQLVQLGQQTTNQTEQLFLEMLRGPISLYFDTDEAFDKDAIEEQVEASLASLRQ
jgi:hypothetical protein